MFRLFRVPFFPASVVGVSLERAARFESEGSEYLESDLSLRMHPLKLSERPGWANATAELQSHSLVET